jgi:hypothetical protein
MIRTELENQERLSSDIVETSLGVPTFGPIPTNFTTLVPATYSLAYWRARARTSQTHILPTEWVRCLDPGACHGRSRDCSFCDRPAIKSSLPLLPLDSVILPTGAVSNASIVGFCEVGGSEAANLVPGMDRGNAQAIRACDDRFPADV